MKYIISVLLIFHLSAFAKTYHYKILDNKIDSKKTTKKLAPKGIKVHGPHKPFEKNKVPPPYISNTWFKTTNTNMTVQKLKWDQLSKDIFLLKLLELTPKKLKKEYPAFSKDQILKLKGLMYDYNCSKGKKGK